MRLITLAVVAFLFGAPVVVEASVIITEVAWMGSATSANHEWIELYNSGSSAEAVDGWVIADGGSLLVTLSGSIGAGQYAVLERTSDASAPGSAFLIYTGALVNTGTTLTLRRDDGQIEDRVDGGDSWQLIGGDNVSKYTAQYGGSTWRTAPPTPGTATVLGSVTEPPSTPVGATSTPDVVTKTPTTAESAVTASNKSRSATIPFQKSTAPLELAISSQEVMYVNQPVTFTAVSKGVGKTVAASLSQLWNFGDLTIATGTKVTHRFSHPGTYIVVVQARFGRHDVVARKEVVVLPVKLSLAKTEDGQVLLQNDSVYDVDVSGYSVKAGNKTVTLPPLSYLAAKQAVPISVGKDIDKIVLIDFKERIVATLEEKVMAAEDELDTEPFVSDNRISSVAYLTERQENSFSLKRIAKEDLVVEVDERLFKPLTDEVATSSGVSASATSSLGEDALGAADRTSGRERWPYGAVALVVLGTLLLVWWPRPAVG